MAEERTNRPQRCALIKEEYKAITGNLLEAVILSQMIYWSERVNNFDNFIAEENERLKTKADGSDGSLLLHGWIRKSAAELKDEIMVDDSSRTISRKLESLVSKGFLLRRSNPEHRYDHKYQYRVNFKVILPALEAHGKTLGRYRANFYANAAKPSTQPEVRKTAVTPAIETVTESEPKTAVVLESIPGNLSDIISTVITEAVTKVLKMLLPEAMQTMITEKVTKAVIAIIPEPVPATVAAAPAEQPASTPALYESKTPEIKSEVKKERFSFRKKQSEAELGGLLEKTEIDTIEDKNVSKQMKTVISDLWRTNRIGKKSVSHDLVVKALTCLTPKSIEFIFEKYTRQERKGLVNYPSEYIKTLIMNASQDWELKKLAQSGSVDSSKPEHDAPSFDIDEYVKLSMEMIDNPVYSAGARVMPAF